jgi:hypothetical protein
MNTLQAFVFGLAIGYVAHAYRISRDPRRFLDRLRAQLQREEGVDVAHATATESSDTAGRTGD